MKFIQRLFLKKIVGFMVFITVFRITLDYGLGLVSFIACIYFSLIIRKFTFQ